MSTGHVDRPMTPRPKVRYRRQYGSIGWSRVKGWGSNYYLCPQSRYDNTSIQTPFHHRGLATTIGAGGRVGHVLPLRAPYREVSGLNLSICKYWKYDFKSRIVCRPKKKCDHMVVSSNSTKWRYDDFNH